MADDEDDGHREILTPSGLVFTFAEGRRLLHHSEAAWVRAIRAERVRTIRIGRQRYVSRRALEDYIASLEAEQNEVRS
jgi:hypothetical protein